MRSLRLLVQLPVRGVCQQSVPSRFDLVNSPRTRTTWMLIAGVAVTAVVVGTMWPDNTVNTSNFVPFREHVEALGCVLTWCDTALESARFAIVDVAGNVFVFIPIGLGFAGALGGSERRRFWFAVAMGFALSLMIEIAQSAIPTRATDVDDLIFNTLGTALGAGSLIWWRWRKRAATPL